MKKGKLGLSPLAIAIGVFLFLLLIGFSCNVKIEIKQKPIETKVEGVEK